MSQDTILKNGATAKVDSQLPASPALDSERPLGITGAFKDKISAAREELKNLRKQEREARIASRMAKQAVRNGRENEKLQAQKDRIAKALLAVPRETFGQWVNEFTVAWREGRVDAEYSAEALKKRADDRALGR